MKKLAFLVMALCFVTSFGFAQEAAKQETMTVNGTVIDNMCADAHKEGLAEFIKTHPKTCALMPDCAASGYSIFADGKLTKFDKASGAKIEEFLKKAESKLTVTAVVKKAGDELSLVSVENQKEKM